MLPCEYMQLLTYFSSSPDWWIEHQSGLGWLLSPVKIIVEPSIAIEFPGYGYLDLVACSVLLIAYIAMFSVGVVLAGTSRSPKKRTGGIILLLGGLGLFHLVHRHNITIFEVKLGNIITVAVCCIIGLTWIYVRRLINRRHPQRV